MHLLRKLKTKVASMNKIYIDWSDFDMAVGELVKWVETRRFDCIVGLSRGGLPIAVSLSNHTNIPIVPITWQTRDGAVRDRRAIERVASRYQNVLVVDDICDSGLTFEQIEKIAPDFSFYSLVNKGNRIVDFYGVDLGRGNEQWVVMPWEKSNRNLFGS